MNWNCYALQRPWSILRYNPDIHFEGEGGGLSKNKRDHCPDSHITDTSTLDFLKANHPTTTFGNIGTMSELQ